jgi:hypothetical protein
MHDRQSPVFPAIRLPQFEGQALPPVALARLRHPEAPALEDVPRAAVAALERSRRLPGLPAGARVAITCGSRGIQGKPAVVKSVVAWLRERGLQPFIVPAMGSHGGARAESQTQLLAALGYTPEAMGCPIEATMEVVQLGTTSLGVPVWFDKYAAEADAVIVINRIKAHTSFDREVESGLTKMVAIGLGKAEGARMIHRLGPRGYIDILLEWARIAAQNSPIAFGIGIVENAEKAPTIIEGVEPEEFAATDARLLQIAKGYIPTLPFKQLDVLVVEQLGKNISGSGMDPAVIARVDIRGQENRAQPFIHKLVVLGLTPETHGNGIGVGVADFMTKEVADQLDIYSMYMNALTATFTERARIPPVMADERAAIQAAVGTCWRFDGENARLCIIRSTLHLEHILVSRSLAPDLDGAGEIVSEPQPLRFDEAGRLLTRCPDPGLGA